MQDGRATETRGRVSVKEAAALAGVSPQTIHTWRDRGWFRATRTPAGDRIDLAEFGEFLALRRAAAMVGIRVETLLRWADGAGE